MKCKILCLFNSNGNKSFKIIINTLRKYAQFVHFAMLNMFENGKVGFGIENCSHEFWGKKYWLKPKWKWNKTAASHNNRPKFSEIV